jgi:uncharacterized protein YjbI with pentapeptide repeats
VLDTYIDPTNATEKKDLVQSFAVVVAGVVGSLSALAAVGNLYISRRNLQQQQRNESERRKQEFQTEEKRRKGELEVENQRAQDEAWQAYLNNMSAMLIPSNDQPSLYDESPPDSLRAVARARTLSVVPSLYGRRKRSVVQFLYESDLITRDRRVVDLTGADFTGADLEKASLSEADLSGAILSEAYMSEAVLEHADLSLANLSSADLSEAKLAGANLRGAELLHIYPVYPGTKLDYADLEGADLREAIFDSACDKESKAMSLDRRSGETYMAGPGVSPDASLTGANLKRANLHCAKLTDKQLDECVSLEGATMPNDQKYEDWLGTPQGQDWIRKYKKTLGADKKEAGVYEDWIKTPEGKMWLKAIG